MVLRPRRLTLVLSLFAGLASVPSAPALLNIDGTRNQIFVFGGLTYGYSSNIFAQADGPSDYTVTAEIGGELHRNAGIISVNSVAKVDFVRYGRFTAENTVNPNFMIEFVKNNGRMTGSLNLQVFREARSDAAVNLRTSSWNFPVTLALKYPLNEKFYTTSSTGYVRRNYDDRSLGLVNYSEYHEDLDLYYSYTSKLDLSAGYRVRVARTDLQGRTVDHWFNIGATGAILAKLTGTVRVGYQLRDVQQGNEQFHHFNVAGSLNWPLTRKLLFSLQASRDFNTIATGATVDSTSVSARAQYTYNRKIDFDAGVATGRNKFLDLTTTDRRDTFYSWDVAAHYRLNEHFRVGGSYIFLHNSSSFSNADFTSHGLSFDITGRY